MVLGVIVEIEWGILSLVKHVIECQVGGDWKGWEKTTIHCLKIWIFGVRDYLKGMERVGGGVCDSNFSI